LTLQVGLAQWRTDLDAMVNLPGTAALDWDGRVLRLTRRHPLSEAASLQVVAWTLRNDGGNGAGSGSWIRWQSAAISQRADWTAAWSRAQTWGQTPSAEDRAQEVPVRALSQWQIFFHRGGAWSNPLSSEGTTPATPGSASNTAPGGPPDGIRLVLDLPAGPSLSGKLTLDWVSPTLTGAAP
jgi:general secretion pathway protein J